MSIELLQQGYQHVDSWEAAEKHWPECSVIWDRDIAAENWVPILRSRCNWPGAGSGYGNPTFTLWADDTDCVNRTRKLGQQSCRCVRWDPDTQCWLSRIPGRDEWKELLKGTGLDPPDSWSGTPGGSFSVNRETRKLG